MAELICAVTTLEVAARLSEDCCLQMAVYGGDRPLVQLVSLMKSCNRSAPSMEVISTTLDILINIGRVERTRDALAAVPRLLPDMLMIMQVFKDINRQIFGKVCALLQLLSSYNSEVPLHSYRTY
jgi:abnormal spindle-like microcephaly-associated protein